MAFEVLMNMVLQANVNIFTASSVYLTTSTPDGEYGDMLGGNDTHPHINRSLDIID